MQRRTLVISIAAVAAIAALGYGAFLFSRAGAQTVAGGDGSSGGREIPGGADDTRPILSSSIRAPIVVYHSVEPDRQDQTAEQKAYSVTPEQLAEELDYLAAHGYTTVTVSQLADYVKHGTTTEVAKPIALTFDDGWENQYTYAFPVLKAHHAVATFYIFTNPIGKDDRFMTWDQVKELHAAGMQIGAHTLSHPLLSKLTPEQLTKEVTQSKAKLEEELGVPITAFASPFGYTNANVQALLASAGYTTGRTLEKHDLQNADGLLRLNAFESRRSMKEFVWMIEYAP